MNGLCIPRTPIVVDYWNLGKVPPRCLFFLTHMHADHTCGLSSSWPHPIHCTAVTGKLLVNKFKIDPKLLIELEVGEAKMLHVNRHGSHVTITVTTLDANHCPGSAMFLFEGYFGRILYTGDFRYCPNMLDDPILNGSRSIDVLYLDNTYCDPACQFPTREKATDDLVSLIKAGADKWKVVIVGLHTLGKEELLVELAMRLKQWVGVSHERMTTLKLLELPDVFSTDFASSFIQVYPFHMVAKKLVSEMSSDEVLAVLPTCLFSGRGTPPLPTGVEVVPYSDHSSFEELRSFVRSVRPRCVKPIVKSFSGDRNVINAVRGDMSVFDDLLDPTPPVEFHVPHNSEDLSNTQPCLNYLSSQTGQGGVPFVKRSNSALINSSSKTQLRNRFMGVRFLSPSPTKSLELLQNEASTESSDQVMCDGTRTTNVKEQSVASENRNSKSECPSSVPSASAPSLKSDMNNLTDLTSSRTELPALGISLQNFKAAQPDSVPTFMQTSLNNIISEANLLSMQQIGKSSTNSEITQSKKSESFKSKLKVHLSLEQPESCARTLPVDSVRLRRNGSIKEGSTGNDVLATPSEGVSDDENYSRTKKEVENSGLPTTELVEEPVARVHLQGESFAAVAQVCGRGAGTSGKRSVGDSSQLCDCDSINNERKCVVVSMETNETKSLRSSDCGARESLVGVCNQTEVNKLPTSHKDEFILRNATSGKEEGSYSERSTTREDSCFNAKSAGQLSPLPKLPSRKNSEVLFGKGHNKGGSCGMGGSNSGLKRKLPLAFLGDFPPPSSNLYTNEHTHSVKRPKQSHDGNEEETSSSDSLVKTPHVLPAYLQPIASSSSHSHLEHFQGDADRQMLWLSGKCLCDSRGTQCVSLCGQCMRSVSQLQKKGLLSSMAQIDLESPHVCQVIHDAIESVSTFEPHAPDGPSSIGRALTPCTCKDGEETNNNNNDCLCGLDSYVVSSATRRSRNNTHFDNWVIRNCSTSSK